MSAINNKITTSIFDSQKSNELKERQKLEELKRQAKVQQVKQSTETCLVELLLLDRKNLLWPEPEGLSVRIKKSLYLSARNKDSYLRSLAHNYITQQSLSTTVICSPITLLSGSSNACAHICITSAARTP